MLVWALRDAVGESGSCGLKAEAASTRSMWQRELAFVAGAGTGGGSAFWNSCGESGGLSSSFKEANLEVGELVTNLTVFWGES